MLKKVHTDNAPQAIGPYSQAVICGNMLYTSGQIAINPATGEVEATDIEGQTAQVMKNLAAVLAEAGTSFDNVVKTTCFLKEMSDFAHSTKSTARHSQASPHAHAWQLKHCLRMYL